jgi:hypothetical protein
MPSIHPGSAAASTVAAGSPWLSRRSAAYSPFAVFVRYSASAGTPFFAANPAPCFVTLPSAAKAIAAGGPTNSSTWPGCCAAIAANRATKRRGVHRTSASASAASSRVARNPAAVRSAICRANPSTQRAGSSSHPSSIQSAGISPLF